MEFYQEILSYWKYWIQHLIPSVVNSWESVTTHFWTLILGRTVIHARMCEWANVWGLPGSLPDPFCQNGSNCIPLAGQTLSHLISTINSLTPKPPWWCEITLRVVKILFNLPTIMFSSISICQATIHGVRPLFGNKLPGSFMGKYWMKQWYFPLSVEYGHCKM